MKMSEVLLIKLDTNGFERFYNRKMQECGCTVLPISDFRREKYGLSVLRPLQLRQLTPRYLAQYRLIVLFEEPALFLYLKKRIDPSRTRLVLWNWNITNRTWLRGNAPLRRRCENWTFDAVDAKKFGWKLNEQFYFAPEALPVRENADGKAGLTAFSACVDKGRYPMMKEMREALRRQGVATDFCLVSEPLRRYAAEDAAWIKTKGLPYEEFLQHTIQSDIVVEVVQSRQVGITVRALEAMFYHKKLITNNAAIRNTPLYHPCNVLIWEPGVQEKLPAFCRLRISRCRKRRKNATPLRHGWITFCSREQQTECSQRKIQERLCQRIFSGRAVLSCFFCIFIVK